MDNTAFVAQMAQFSGLEQLVNMTDAMQQMAIAQAVSNGTGMVSFVGKEVAYIDDTMTYEAPGDQTLGVELGGKANKITVTVHDEEGKLVKTIEVEGNFKNGLNEVTWGWHRSERQPGPIG